MSETTVMTFAQLAERLGIEVASAKARARRGNWQRLRGNDGKTLVHVPIEALNEPRPEKAEPQEPAVSPQHLVELEKRHRAQLDELKAEHAVTVGQLRQDQIIELERVANIHRAEVERLMSIIQQLTKPRSWWSRLRGEQP